MSLSAKINEKANLIRAIADKLTGVYKPHEYGEVILTLTVIRQFDCAKGYDNRVKKLSNSNEGGTKLMNDVLANRMKKRIVQVNCRKV